MNPTIAYNIKSDFESKTKIGASTPFGNTAVRFWPKPVGAEGKSCALKFRSKGN